LQPERVVVLDYAADVDYPAVDAADADDAVAVVEVDAVAVLSRVDAVEESDDPRPDVVDIDTASVSEALRLGDRRLVDDT
jgi:hypothetical protein